MHEQFDCIVLHLVCVEAIALHCGLPVLVEVADQNNRNVVFLCKVSYMVQLKGDAITRVLGTTDIMGSCRSYIALGTVPSEDDIRWAEKELEY